jgi:hypothetical protein
LDRYSKDRVYASGIFTSFQMDDPSKDSHQVFQEPSKPCTVAAFTIHLPETLPDKPGTGFFISCIIKKAE